MVDKELIKNKLADIQGYYQELELILEKDVPEIMKDSLKLHTVERLFQLIVDTAVDINTHIIAESDIQAPADYQSTFLALAENKIIPMDFATKIAPSVGLRNLVVHKYGKVDTRSMIEDIKKEIGDYLEYMKIINVFAEKL